MLFTSEPFEPMTPEELAKYGEILTGLRARLLIDDMRESHRRHRSVLNAKYLAATDVKRAVESLDACRKLVAGPTEADPPPDAATDPDR